MTVIRDPGKACVRRCRSWRGGDEQGARYVCGPIRGSATRSQGGAVFKQRSRDRQGPSFAALCVSLVRYVMGVSPVNYADPMPYAGHCVHERAKMGVEYVW